MKRKLKLSTLQVESFVTVKDRVKTMIGGSLPTDTTPYLCIYYSEPYYLCRTADTTCINTDHPVICFATLEETCVNLSNQCALR